MNFLNNNNINYIDFPIWLGGIIQTDTLEFLENISIYFEPNTTYRFIVTSNGKPLTKNGVPYDSIVYTFPCGKVTNDPFGLGDLQWNLEDMVRYSDLLKDIYACEARNNLNPQDTSVPLDTFLDCDCDLNLSLAYFKSVF